MANELLPKKNDVITANTYPVAYMLVLAILFASIVLGLYIAANKGQNNDCKENLQIERANTKMERDRRKEAEDKLTDFLIDQQTQKQFNHALRDSQIRATVGDKAKRILKANQ